MEDNKLIPKFCINCSTPFHLEEEDHHHQNFQGLIIQPAHFSSSSAPTTKSSSTTSRGWWISALHSIFKLNYLSAFDSADDEEDQIDEDDLCLCSNCSEILNNLYQLENEFFVLGKIDSYLKKKLDRLDTIIEAHRQKSIHCDLITRKGDPRINYVDSVPLNTKLTNSPSFTLPHLARTNNKNFDDEDEKFKEKEPKISTTTTSILDREPRIILTRLSPNSLRVPQTDVSHQNNDFDVPADETDVSLSDHDDDDYVASPSSQPESLQEGTSEDDEEDDPDIKFSRRSRRATRNSSFDTKTSDTNSVTGDDEKESSLKKRVPGRPKTYNKRKYTYIKKGRKLLANPKQTRTPEQKAKRKAVTEYSLYLAKRAKFVYPCWYCKKTDFGTLTDLLNHTKKEHLPTLLVVAESPSSTAAAEAAAAVDYTICENCAKVNFTADDVVFHQSKCSLIAPETLVPPKYQCKECLKVFADSWRLQSHMAIHSTHNPLRCDEEGCDYGTKWSSSLKFHKIRKHNRRADELEEEEKNKKIGKSEESGFKCDQCDAVLKSKKVWYSHRKFMHTTEGKERYIKKLAKERGRTKKIKELNPVVLPTICEDCKIDFYNRLAYINHRRVAHADNLDKEHMCPICGFTFARAFSLAAHTKRVHSDERPFVCETCGKSFKRGYNLKSHSDQVHTVEGKLKYRAFMKERTQRMKLIAKQLENVNMQQQQQQQQQQFPDQHSSTFNLEGPADGNSSLSSYVEGTGEF